jgi:hypothetical protein
LRPDVKASEDKANTKQEILDMIANSEPKSGYWLSLDFIKEFKKAKPKDPETALVNQDIQCPHLGLTFESEKNRKIVSSEVRPPGFYLLLWSILIVYDRCGLISLHSTRITLK